MKLASIMGLLGGLALFLYGMKMMSNGLEVTAGNKIKNILEKMTSNRFIGVLMGALVTAIIQSSSATTVMVVGFVNIGMMNLNQAIWIIMGANIGTTITGQLIALDIGTFAPLLAFVGVVVTLFVKKEKFKYPGEIIAGLGILFIGMSMMSQAMKPLAESERFVGMLTEFKNPIAGIAAGTVFTAVVQSSSASVGMLQALAGSGVIGLESAAFVLFGQNIGTCITALIASAGTTQNAKRTTIVHILFNVFGTIVFTILCISTPFTDMIIGWTPDNPELQIANLHTIFNVVTTILLLPFGTWLGKIATFTLRDKAVTEKEVGMKTLYLADIHHINSDKHRTFIVCFEGIKMELQRMIKLAGENVEAAFDIVRNRKKEKLSDVKQREEYVDFLNREITGYITDATAYETTATGNIVYNSLFSITVNIERISDHAMNIAEYSEIISEKKIHFSEQTILEVEEMKNTCSELFTLLTENSDNNNLWHHNIMSMEQKMDDMTVLFRENMYKRIREGKCTDEGCVVYTEILTDFERIGDHALNIADEILRINRF
ncbi:MAG: Na/Pi cotransporter family protein [Butyrivibrio sp.]|nr:Na/Pi cotransporter family protein [Butyrivibrio sp.]